MNKNKQEKFHDSLLKILYPPPPSPQTDSDDEEKHNKLLLETLHNFSDELENEETNPSNTDQEQEEEGNDKLTRAQRKRLRKKKLKESVSQRRKIIGPLLVGDEGSVERVRQNASMGTNAIVESLGEMKQSKLKQRRKSKKLATKESLTSSNVETSTSNSNVHHLEKSE